MTGCTITIAGSYGFGSGNYTSSVLIWGTATQCNTVSVSFPGARLTPVNGVPVGPNGQWSAFTSLTALSPQGIPASTFLPLLVSCDTGNRTSSCSATPAGGGIYPAPNAYPNCPGTHIALTHNARPHCDVHGSCDVLFTVSCTGAAGTVFLPAVLQIIYGDGSRDSLVFLPGGASSITVGHAYPARLAHTFTAELSIAFPANCQPLDHFTPLPSVTVAVPECPQPAV